MAAGNLFADFTDVKGFFWNQNRRRSTGNTGVQRNPPGISSHEFNDHDSVVAFGSCMQAINCISGNLNRRVKPKCEVGPKNIVINGFRNTNHGQASLFKDQRCHRQRSISTDDDEPIKLLFGEAFLHQINSISGVKRATATGTQDRSPSRQQSSNIGFLQRNVTLLHHSIPRIEKSQEFIVVGGNAFTDHRSDDRV